MQRRVLNDAAMGHVGHVPLQLLYTDHVEVASRNISIKD